MIFADAIARVTALRNRLPVRAGSVPVVLTAEDREALTLVLAAASVEQVEPRYIRTQAREPNIFHDLTEADRDALRGTTNQPPGGNP